MTSGVKLLVGAILVAGAIGYLAYAGAASSWQYYLSVDEAAAESASLFGKQIRVSGRVSPGSLSVEDDRRQATFEFQGERHAMHVSCHCLLPDNLAENIDVVVEGTVEAGRINGHKVITRCASKYQPKQSPDTPIESPGNRT